jgi:signal transduction histidine kinase
VTMKQLLGARCQPHPTMMACGRDRRGPLIGGIIITIVVALAVLRELIAPATALVAGHDLDATAGPAYIRPLCLFINLVLQLVALNLVARTLDRRGWRPVWHVVVTVWLSLVIGFVSMFGLKLVLGIESPFERSLLGGPIAGIQIYALWVLAFRYPKVVDDARARALEAERLRRTAELARLREHLQPHFLRNTLNAVAAFVTEEPDAARDLLAALGDLLTDSLENDDAMQSLGEETEWLRRYTEIFAARHRGALRFSWDLDPAADTVQLPRLLLQPLVENAVHHGALARTEGGEVRVQTRRTADGVTVTVTDDGPGIDARRPEGLGLHLVRRRLAIECHDSHLRLESSAAGTRAIVELR